MSLEAFKQARQFLFDNRTNYAAAYAGFRWPVMETFNFALDWFDAELARGPLANNPALQIEGEGAATLTFAQLSERSNRVANAMRALGVKRGDRILLMLGNVVPLWEVMLAAIKLGAVVVPTSTLLNKPDLADRLARGRVKHIVAATADCAKFDGLDPQATRIAVGEAPPGWTAYETLHTGAPTFTPDGPTNASDPLLLYFTSGTTAKPKLVLHTHQSYPVGSLSTMFALGLQPGDKHLNISSPGWAKHAWSCFFTPWLAGATIFILNQPRFNAKAMLDALAQHKVTSLCAPPTVWRMFIQEDLKSWKMSLRELLSAGEPLNPEVMDQVEAAWHIVIRDVYGQTETTAQIGNPPGLKVKPGSMGVPMPGYRMRLLNTQDQDANEGEVCIALDPKPPSLMQGYQNEDGTFQPLGTDVYRTGDVASRDAEGYLTFIGRSDDVFKASDYRISPFELESVLIEHPAIAEAAVVPAPDSIRLAVPKAYIVLAPGSNGSPETALSIFRHCRDRLPPFQRIRRLEFSDLPKTISGKIRRVELRQSENARAERAPGEYREDDFPQLKA